MKKIIVSIVVCTQFLSTVLTLRAASSVSLAASARLSAIVSDPDSDQTKLLEFLDATPVDLEQPDSVGWLPLHKAVALVTCSSSFCCVGKVNALLKRGANPNSVLCSGTVLDRMLYAYHSCDWADKSLIVACVQVLLAYGATQYKAEYQPYLAQIKEEIAKTSIATLPDSSSIWSSDSGDFDSIDIDLRNEDGSTALHKAAAYGDSDVVRRLLAAGADVNARDNDGRTPLHLAVRHAHCFRAESVVSLLVQAGASGFAACNYGATPLESAMKYAVTQKIVKMVCDARDKEKNRVMNPQQ